MSSSDGIPDSEKIPIGFDVMVWAEIAGAIKSEIARIKRRTSRAPAHNSLFDLMRALKRIDGVMSGEEEADYGLEDDPS